MSHLSLQVLPHFSSPQLVAVHSSKHTSASAIDGLQHRLVESFPSMAISETTPYVSVCVRVDGEAIQAYRRDDDNGDLADSTAIRYIEAVAGTTYEIHADLHAILALWLSFGLCGQTDTRRFSNSRSDRASVSLYVCLRRL